MLIQNQLAAKELYIARYYISIKKWVPAINRLKNIVNNYEKTIFVEEALHRLVETHHHLGLKKEAREFAKILGYNYNSSEWYKKSYKVLNKNYKIEKISSSKSNKESIEKSFLDKIIDIIRWQLMKENTKIIGNFKKKIKELKKHNQFYYTNDKPQISDAEYD